MKVTNMKGKNGRTIPNQFVIDDKDYYLFQSYKSVIAKKYTNGKIKLDADMWDYSHTTSKYRNQFLDMTTKEIKAKIKSGEIELVDLNK